MAHGDFRVGFSTDKSLIRCQWPKVDLGVAKWMMKKICSYLTTTLFLIYGQCFVICNIYSIMVNCPVLTSNGLKKKMLLMINKSVKYTPFEKGYCEYVWVRRPSYSKHLITEKFCDLYMFLDLPQTITFLPAKLAPSDLPAGNYLFHVNNENTRTMYEIWLQWRHSGVFIVNFEQILLIILVFLLLKLY